MVLICLKKDGAIGACMVGGGCIYFHQAPHTTLHGPYIPSMAISAHDMYSFMCGKMVTACRAEIGVKW